MKQVLIRQGTATVTDVPAPTVSPGRLLVRTAWSCISTGTEVATVRSSAQPLHQRALHDPSKIGRALQMVAQHGVRYTVQRVLGHTHGGTAVGYSAAGVVIDVGSSVAGFKQGDLVACAGTGYANHAEILDVPQNLVVRVPSGVSAEHASTVALGAIALQGVRRVEPTLGEVVVVMGLGILGQLTVQMLLANGCQVIASDPDPLRRQWASHAGVLAVLDPRAEDLADRARLHTAGRGADAAVITAASASHQLMHDALQACRRKGRVIIVGEVGLHLQRADLYAKELDVRISTSYGPGRYDPTYEEQGLDYPVPYVRWTENRNMGEYLRLLANGRITLPADGLRQHTVDEAPQAYRALTHPQGPAPLLALLRYPERAEARHTTLRLEGARPPRKGLIGVAVVGAGDFANGTHLPILARLTDEVRVHAVVSRNGAKARATALEHRAALVSTELDAVLRDDSVDLVLITTRHHLHARMALACLQAGKAVFVEKPLALTHAEIDAIEAFYQANPAGPMLFTGFNRRFSPAMRQIQQLLANRSGPLMATYRMNAGPLPAGHWTQGVEGGGRNLGEACHIYDLFGFWCGAPVVEVLACGAVGARPCRSDENFTAMARFADGSVCSLAYTALGHRSLAKEQCELFVDGQVLRMDDYQHLQLHGSHPQTWSWPAGHKGHLEEWRAVVSAMRSGGAWPLPLGDQLQATRLALAVQAQIGAFTPQAPAEEP